MRQIKKMAPGTIPSASGLVRIQGMIRLVKVELKRSVQNNSTHDNKMSMMNSHIYVFILTSLLSQVFTTNSSLDHVTFDVWDKSVRQ